MKVWLVVFSSNLEGRQWNVKLSSLDPTGITQAAAHRQTKHLNLHTDPLHLEQPPTYDPHTTARAIGDSQTTQYTFSTVATTELE